MEEIRPMLIDVSYEPIIQIQSGSRAPRHNYQYGYPDLRLFTIIDAIPKVCM